MLFQKKLLCLKNTAIFEQHFAWTWAKFCNIWSAYGQGLAEFSKLFKKLRQNYLIILDLGKLRQVFGQICICPNHRGKLILVIFLM